MSAPVTIAETVEEAVAASGEYRAGGTDVQARRRSGLSTGPLVDIHRLDGYDRISRDEAGATTFGALVRLHTIAADEAVSRDYPGLAQSAGALATPQIRQMATLGGSLLQRTRCWYYRHPQISCFKSGGDGCPARTGHNPNGVVFDLGPCVYPHPATMGVALLAYEATFTTHGQDPLPLSELFGDGSDPSRDHTLAANELLTQIQLPSPVAEEKAAYFRVIARAEAEWPMVECLARLAVAENTITMARVAVGGVANIPLRLHQVESVLEGGKPSQGLLEEAARRAGEGANPLPQTAYKVRFLVNGVLEALERAAAA